jgi:hypothetical protein
MGPAVRRFGSEAGVTFIACGCYQIVFLLYGAAVGWDYKSSVEFNFIV